MTEENTSAKTGVAAKDETSAETGNAAKDKTSAETGGAAKDESSAETGNAAEDKTPAETGDAAKDENSAETGGAAKDKTSAETGDDQSGVTEYAKLSVKEIKGRLAELGVEIPASIREKPELAAFLEKAERRARDEPKEKSRSERSDWTEFKFEVPDWPAEERKQVKMKSPDGIDLFVQIPDDAKPGDNIHMEKRNGDWVMIDVIRTAPSKVIPPKSAEDLASDLSGSDVVSVRLDTTKGLITIKVVPSWAPIGVERFLQLVDDGYFSDLAFYRAVPDFLVQFGVTSDKEKRDRYEAIKDDCVKGVPYEEGSVCFAAAGPNRRASTVCIFMTSVPDFGQQPWETIIGKVQPDSLEVLRNIFTGYGEMPQCGGEGPDPTKLAELGNKYIVEHFPKCDFVKSASRDL